MAGRVVLNLQAQPLRAVPPIHAQAKYDVRSVCSGGPLLAKRDGIPYRTTSPKREPQVLVPCSHG